MALFRMEARSNVRAWRSPLNSRFQSLAVIAGSLVGAASCSSPKASSEEVEAFPNRRLALPRDRTLGFVANQDSDTVSVIEFDSASAGGVGGEGEGSGEDGAISVLTEVPIGRDPVDFDGLRSLLLDRRRDAFHVALTYSQSATSAHVASARRAGYLQVLGRGDLRPLWNLRLEPAVFALALSPDGCELVASHNDTELPAIYQGDPLLSRAVLAFVDPDAPERAPVKVPLCIAPADVAYGSDEALFVACVGDDSVLRLQRDTKEVTSSLDIDPTAPQKPVWIELDANSAHMAVSYEVTRQLGVLQATEALRLEHLVRVEGVPKRALWLSDDRLLVPTVGPDALVVIDLTTDSVAREIRLAPNDCRAPGALTESASGQLYLVCQNNHFEPGTLLQLDREGLDIVARADLGLFPDRLVLDER